MNNRSTNSTKVLFHQPGHFKPVNSIQEIGGHIFTGSEDGRICIWDKNMNEELGCIYAHDAPIIDIQRTIDDRFLITCAKELSLKIWFMKDFNCADSVKSHISTLLGAKAIGQQIISASKDLQLKKWDIVENKLKLVEQTRVISMDKYFADKKRLFISSTEGDKIVLDPNNFKQITTLFVSDSKVIRAIRKASKYVKEFAKQDPHALLFNISRRNGFSILAFKATPNFIILGHEFGFVSLWNIQNLKLAKAFFTHGKHITGIEIHEENLFATSLDSTIVKFDMIKLKPIKTIELPEKPYSLLKNSSNDFIVGLGNGEIRVYDSNLELKKAHRSIRIATSIDIAPNSLIVSYNTGEIQILNNSNLEIISTTKLHDKSILGVFYYDNRIISVSEDNRILVMDENLNIIKTVEFAKKKTDVRRIRQYITLTPNYVFDLNKNEVIKGEISGETEKELSNIKAFETILTKGDVLLKINQKILSGIYSDEIKDYYSQEIIESLLKLVKASEKAHYKQTSEFTILSDNISK